MAQTLIIGIVVALAVITVFIIICRRAHLKAVGAFMGSFARSIGYQYSAQGDASTLRGKELFPPGTSVVEGATVTVKSKIINVLSGKVESAPVRIFHYRSVNYETTGRGKGKETGITFSKYTVFEITLPKSLPEIFVSPHIPGFDSIIGAISNIGGGVPGLGEQVRLEGDFYKHFTIYVPKEFITKAYQIFTPDVMEKLEDQKIQNKGKTRGFDLEFCEDKLYLHIPRIISDTKTMSGLFDLIKVLAVIFMRNIEYI